MSLRGHIFEAKASLFAEYAGFIDAIGELCIGVDSIVCDIVLIDDADTVLGYGDGGSLSILGYGDDPAAGLVILGEIALVIEPGFEDDVYGLVFCESGAVIVDNDVMPGFACAAEAAAVAILVGIGSCVEILDNVAVQILDIECDEACVTEQNELNIGESIKDSITANNRNSLELNSLPSVISDFQLAFMSYELTKLMQVNSTGKAIIPEMNIMNPFSFI